MGMGIRGRRGKVPSREKYRAWLLCFANYIAYRDACTKDTSGRVVSSRSFVVLAPGASASTG